MGSEQPIPVRRDAGEIVARRMIGAFQATRTRIFKPIDQEGSSNRASRGQRSGIVGRWRNLEPGATIWTSFTRRRAAMEQHYVGLDVGLEETSLCIVDSEGKTVREVKVSTEPAAIRSALEGCADRLSRIGVEASSLGLWLSRELRTASHDLAVEDTA